MRGRRRLVLAGFIAWLFCCLAGSTAAQPAADPAAVAALVARQTTAFRAANGLGPLGVDRSLAFAAQRFAEYMAHSDQYGHEADGRKPTDRALQQGYEYCMVAENIAIQFSSSGFDAEELATRFVQGWEQSPEHRRNMLLPAVLDIGVGIAQSGRTRRYYAVQMLGRPKAAAARFEITNRTEAPVSYELDAQSYVLPPRVVRAHQGCFTGRLKLAGGADRAATVPQDGSRYTVLRDAAGQLRLEVVRP